MLRLDSIDELVMRGTDSLGFHGGLILELGPGRGAFALELAYRNPHDFHLLIDMHRQNVTSIIRSIRARNLRNIGIIHGIAHEQLAKLGGDVFFSAIHCHFPSPFNSVKDNGPRLYGASTCQQVLRLTETGSELFAVSDKCHAVTEFERNLAPAFQAAPWIAPLSPPLIPGAVIGTENERIHCLSHGTEPSHVRLVRR